MAKKNDKAIRQIVNDIASSCRIYSDYIKAYNECAWSDRYIEEIIENALKLKKLYDDNFDIYDDNFDNVEKGE